MVTQRDHRPDLKQFIIDLMCSGDGDVPLYLRVADGNVDVGIAARRVRSEASRRVSDQAIFAQLMKGFRELNDSTAGFNAANDSIIFLQNYTLGSVSII